MKQLTSDAVFDDSIMKNNISFSVFSLPESFYSLYLFQFSLQWRHNGRIGVSNHQPHDCLLNRLFKA